MQDDFGHVLFNFLLASLGWKTAGIIEYATREKLFDAGRTHLHEPLESQSGPQQRVYKGHDK